jgi:isoleucyl-tRNA synthetase
MSNIAESTPSEKFSFVETEKKILDFWKSQKIFEKSLEKTKDKKPYVFYDGPPFATGLPHHGHLVASTLKDVVPRYFTMKGRYVSRRFGWDCHGLPIEQEIDKKFGMSAMDFVEKNGIKAYNDECRGIVQRFTGEWEKTVSRIGRWVDFEDDYKTMDLNYMESVWWVFKQMWDKGLIYKGNKIVPYSTELQTALSNFEATSNYQDVQDPAVTILFKLEDEDTYLSAWTTTPWTLPSNLALIVNQDIDYVKVHEKTRGINIIMAETRIEAYKKQGEFEILETFKGSELKGKRYRPLFPYFKHLAAEGAFQVLTDDYVTTTDGTGLVHSAPAFGEDDSRVMKAAGIKCVACPIDSTGRFTEEVSDFKGEFIKDADKKIIKYLKDNNHLFHQSVLVHSYPFCPRTDTPLIYRAMPQWYLAVEKIKDKIINANKQINWVPEHIKEGRFGKWLDGARDWAIGRTRIWGTPLPIWHNETSNNFICVGSIEELKNVSGVELSDLHREYTDPIVFTKDGEEGEYKRIPEVLDCWFESGAMPYAQLHYPFENKEVFENGFPAEYIAEGLDQTRGWFYTLTVLSAALFDKPAFKNVIVNGMVLAGDGKKMSKRLRNYTQPDILMEEFGADALRLFLINSALVKGEELKFTDDGLKDMVRRALLPWLNSFKFFQTYAKIDGWKADENLEFGENILDRWLLSKLQTLTANVNKEMDAYHLYNVVPELFNYIEDLTNWYIRLNRRRFWENGLETDKRNAYSALYTTLLQISKLMAPFAPFLSEHIYQELKEFNAIKEESVHLCDYPEFDQNFLDSTLEDAVDRMQQIILLGRQKRNQEQVKVKTPLKNLTVIHKDQSLLDEISKLEMYLQTELNVKEVNYSQEEDKFIKLYAKPNSPVLGKRLGKGFGKMCGMIKKISEQELQRFEAGETITLGGETLSEQDLLIFREAKEGTQALSNRLISIDLNCILDQELIDEGIAREIVNRIQRTRKEIGFEVTDRISIAYTGSKEVIIAADKHQAYITKETLCDSFVASELSGDIIEFKIDEWNFSMSLKKNSKQQ